MDVLGRATLVSLICLVFAGCSASQAAAPSDGAASPALSDPIAQNGPIFKGWAKPKLALVFTGEQLGYIEPCGCAGLENQKGGLRRRDTFLKQLREQGWPVVALDNGGLIRRFNRQQEIKFTKAVEGLKLMDYKAVGFGPDDLKLPAGSLLAAIAGTEMFVSANTGLFELGSDDVPRFRIIEAGGMKIGVTSVLGDRFQKQITNDDIALMPAKAALKEVVPKLAEKKCDHYVLLAHATLEETTELAKAYPLFDIAVMAHGADEPPHELKKIPGTKTTLIEVGHKGMYAITLGIYEDKPVRFQRVPLDHRFADAAEIDELVVGYQDELEQLSWQGLGLRPAPHAQGKFVGSKACADCHRDEYAVWKATPHAHATETLTHVKPPRQFDPECISCHATGWNPQEFFPYVSGYASIKETPMLNGSGCENCHGPGAEHTAAEKGSDKTLQRRLREAIARTGTGATKESQRESCMRCHDLDNSPKFDFDKYWAKIQH
ncbi:MAG TPA: multiheme c-type cytochrome [Pirellulales bacterium]|nr:multiheme c-type cytochrome [Pirellulales bacterium]